MSFTDEVKQELIHRECEWDCCARAEIAAAILLSGGLSFRGAGRYGISINLSRPAASRYYFSLIKKHLGMTTGIRTHGYKRLGERTQVELSFSDEDVPGAMEILKLHDEKALFGIAAHPSAEIIKNPCCKTAFLKSAFLITGSVSSPEREYSLTMSVSSPEAAQCLCDTCVEKGLNARVSTNRQKYVVYIKSAEGVGSFLTLTGANAARLRLENVRIMKDIKNGTNRQTNCDSNNIERTVKSAEQQLADIRFLAEATKGEGLPAWMREMMSLRLENPDSSLTELGELCDPPIGKSGVNNRLRRISEMAAKLRDAVQPVE